MKSTLWTKNFTIITLGTIISAIGDVAMSFTFSFIIYDQSQSTFLSGLFSAFMMIPKVILPLVAAPILDRFPKKIFIVGFDGLAAGIYLLVGIYFLTMPFHFIFYFIFALLMSCIGSIYQLAYQSLYPKLIPEGFSQKGYTVSGMIYPTVMIVMNPVAAFLYQRLGMGFITICTGCLLLTACLLETQIIVTEQVVLQNEMTSPWKQYIQDAKTALLYLKQEKGLQKIYTYIPITQGISMGTSVLLIAWFRTNPNLQIEMYSFFTMVEFIGRSIGGFVNYRIPIPANRRFSIAYFVYQIYSVMDAILLFLPYPFMLINRAICGFLGINSATLRESSVQNYIPDSMRAKVNSLFSILITISTMFFQLLVGAVGEVVSAPICMLVFSALNIFFCWAIVYRGKESIKAIYNHVY